jgi:hypothetical protein
VEVVEAVVVLGVVLVMDMIILWAETPCCFYVATTTARKVGLFCCAADRDWMTVSEDLRRNSTTMRVVARNVLEMTEAKFRVQPPDSKWSMFCAQRSCFVVRAQVGPKCKVESHNKVRIVITVELVIRMDNYLVPRISTTLVLLEVLALLVARSRDSFD